MSQEFYRPVEYADAVKCNGVERKKAIRFYESQRCTDWSIQVRAPIRLAYRGAEGKDFIVATAHLGIDELRLLAAELNKAVREAEEEVK